MSNTRIAKLVLVALLLGSGAGAAVYQEPADFISEAFRGSPPAPEVLWLTGALGSEVEQLLGHPPFSKRLRYWRDGARSVWVLDEIGKEQPITTGIVIDEGRIAMVRILVFRESRGWEVRHDFFTRQFSGAQLSGPELDRSIDGISGATLSVIAVEKLARVALLLDRSVAEKDLS
jgi:hypothetical protein